MEETNEFYEGASFWHWTILERVDRRKYLCVCDCGKKRIVDKYSIKKGKSKSCGCMKNVGREPKHGLRGTRLYSVWHGMKCRCNNKSHVAYWRYGGRGVQVCQQWQRFEAFAEWALENGYSDDLTIDRIDVNGNYCPENCRWATYEEQENNRRDTIKYDVCGERLTIAQISRKYNIPPSTISYRQKKGMDLLRGRNS